MSSDIQKNGNRRCKLTGASALAAAAAVIGGAPAIAQDVEEEEVVVYFWQTGCEYCEQVKPYVEPLIEEYDAVSINLADHNVWTTYGINGTPTMIRFQDGKEVGRVEGAVSEQQYETFFKNEEGTQ